MPGKSVHLIGTRLLKHAHMKSLKYKNIDTRSLLKKHEKRRLIAKTVLTFFLSLKKKKPLSVFKQTKTHARYCVSKNSKTFVTNPCIVTNRAKGVSTKFSSSRFVLRNLMAFGLIPGYKKAVW